MPSFALQGQLELANASQEVLHNNSLLADSMERFEMKKLADTKVSAAPKNFLQSKLSSNGDSYRPHCTSTCTAR